MSEKFSLMKHQRYALGCMGNVDHMAIFYEAGTGKTAIALTWLINAMKKGKVRNALIVCPSSLVGNWKTSMQKMAQFEGVSSEDVRMLMDRTQVTSFRKTWVGNTTVRRHRDGSEYKVKNRSLSPAVDRQWDAVIIDESHAIGGHSSSQTQACLLLAKLSKYRFIMSGTPVSGSTKGSGRDWQKLYGQIKFLDPNRWSGWTAFCKECVSSYDRWFKPASYNEKICEEIIQQYGIFARLEDCVDMPGFTDTTIPCELLEKKVYKDVRNMCLMDYNIDPKTAGASFIKLLQVCSGHLRDDDKNVLPLKTSKDEALEDILEGTDDKVVVFCNFTPSVDRCAEISRKVGRRTVVFDGRSKTETWREFQFGDADTIVVQYQAGGAGLDLYAGHTMILFEPCLSSLNMTQAKARIYRTGQKEKCRYIALSTTGTIEEKVWMNVLNGVDVTARMMCDYASM